MEKKYKLKQEVRKFFPKMQQKEVGTLDSWKKNYTVGIEILEEVPRVYITAGISRDDDTTVSISGWNSPSGEAHFHFTARIQDFDHKEYDEMNLPEAMDEIQKVLNKYFTRY